jgi:Ribbon-helix-helix domain
MVKTTVYLDQDVAYKLRWMSESTGRAKAELIREALEKYTAEFKRPLPKGAGMFDSGRTDISANYREMLKQAVKEGRWR